LHICFTYVKIKVSTKQLINTNHSTKSNTMTDRYRKVKELSCFNTRILNVKYLGPTNTKGSRIKIIDHHFNQSVTISYNYEYSNALQGAVDYLLENGWDVIGFNSECHKTEYIIIIKEWDSTQQLRG